MFSRWRQTSSSSVIGKDQHLPLLNLLITMLVTPAKRSVKRCEISFALSSYAWNQSSWVANTGLCLLHAVPDVQGHVQQDLSGKKKRRNFHSIMLFIIEQKSGAFKCRPGLCVNKWRQIESGVSPNESATKLQPIWGIRENFLNFIQMQTSYFRVMLSFGGHESVSGALVVTTREETGWSCTGQRVREVPFLKLTKPQSDTCRSLKTSSFPLMELFFRSLNSQ